MVASDLEDKVVYVIGSLKNKEKIVNLYHSLNKIGVGEVFIDWLSPGPDADDFWRDLERDRGNSYGDALNAWSGKHVFEFDSFHIERADLGIMCMPCGKSGHLEFGNMLGSGKRAYTLLDDPSEFLDIYSDKSDGVFCNPDDLEMELTMSGHKPTERDGFENLFNLYHVMRLDGKTFPERRARILGQMERTLENENTDEAEVRYKLAAELSGSSVKSISEPELDLLNTLPHVLQLPGDESIKKQTHMELGLALGSGRRGYIGFDEEPDRWDVMYQFADGIYFDKGSLDRELVENGDKPTNRSGFGNIFYQNLFVQLLIHILKE